MAESLALEAPRQTEPRWRVIWRNAFPFLVVAAIWEIVARAAVFPPRLFPSIETIAAAVGYQNPFAFSTTFKKWIGWRPSEHRSKQAVSVPPKRKSSVGE